MTSRFAPFASRALLFVLTLTTVLALPRMAFALGGREEALVAMGFFACTAIVAVAVVVGFHLRAAQRHQTLRAMVEKGMEIPPRLLAATPRPASARTDQRRGILLLCAGLGIGLFLLVSDGVKEALLGLIPASVGVGYLILASIEQKEADKVSEAGRPILP